MKKFWVFLQQLIDDNIRLNVEIAIMFGSFLVCASAVLIIINNDFWYAGITMIIGFVLATKAFQVLPKTKEEQMYDR